MHGFGGSVTVRVHEVEGAADHVVSLSGEACQLAEIPLQTKPGSKKSAKYKKLAEEAKAGAAG
eukprot:1194266-Prorocentrum_minimum.AAC.2